MRVRTHLRSFLSCKRGNVAITFALAIIPIIGGIGAAIDYSRAAAVRTSMQAALDATALATSKTAANLSAAQLTQQATNYFKATFNRPEARAVKIAASYTSTATTSSVTVTGIAQINTDFMGIIGVNSINIGGLAKTVWGITRLRVALVLDNTGSMADAGKMNALKTATKNLLTQLHSAAAAPDDIYVSIIPFAKDVAVDTSNYNATWIDWTDWEAANGTCADSGGWQESKKKAKCKKWNSADRTTWNGCITDRGLPTGPAPGNYDTNALAPTASVAGSLFPAEQYAACPQPAMGLNNNWSAMTRLVNAMRPNGNTNQGIGLAWGWLSLMGGGPFTVPTSNYKSSEVIILLTDGLNTENRWYSNQSSIDAREKITCDNVKAAHITIYAIQVNTANDPTSTLLQNGASDSKKFFLLKTASQIVSVFQQIGADLSQLRLSQ